MSIHRDIEKLVIYGTQQKLLSPLDKPYAINRLLTLLDLKEFEPSDISNTESIDYFQVLENIIQYAADHKIIESVNAPFNDLLDAALMDCLMPRPSEVNRVFNLLFQQSPEEATEYFYKLSQDSHYIRTDRTSKNLHWSVETEFGEIEITINLSKPEKDPKAIELAANQPPSAYPKCLLCVENVGYEGHVSHPARQNHRIIPLSLNNEQWYFQYSPYAYFTEHSIILKQEHSPMQITKETFIRLADFLDLFPHYFIGSNADLPIVGGSILNHDHFQGGKYHFPIEKAKIIQEFVFEHYSNTKIKYLSWPLTVLRVEGNNKDEIVELTSIIHSKWKDYSDPDNDIYSQSNNTRHNTVTPIARKHGENYQFDLILRNNRTSEEFPLGIFHPHPFVHPVKKENIGLIETMGLAILPGRLITEIDSLAYALFEDKPVLGTPLEKFTQIMEKIKMKYSTLPEKSIKTAIDIIKKEFGFVFTQGLKDSGVYKSNNTGKLGLVNFINSLGL